MKKIRTAISNISHTDEACYMRVVWREETPGALVFDPSISEQDAIKEFIEKEKSGIAIAEAMRNEDN